MRVKPVAALTKGLALSSLSAIATAALAQPAPVATDAPPAPMTTPQAAEQGTPPGAAIADIVVTAQKRSQRVQDVPLAVQVVTESTLQSQGVRQFADLTKATPSLLIRPSEQPVNNSLSVRGIGTFAFSPGVEQSVAVQIDDVPVQFVARAFADLSDIERIEVLRGPQSTLYGRSASAGLINIVTQAPTKTLTGRVSGLVTADDEQQIMGALSGPLTDRLGFRVSGNYDRWSGNVHNLATDDTVNGFRTLSLKGKLVWDPTSALSITAQGGYIDGRTTIGRPFIRVSPNARLRGVPAYGPSVFAPGVTFSDDNQDVVNNINSGTKYRDYSASLRASLDLGFATFMSITGYDRFRQFDILDQDESAIAALDNRQFGTFRTTSWSQELRLVSPSRHRLRYTLGLFYASLDLTRPFVRGPFFSLANWYATTGTKQYAAFGQVEYDILRNTTLIGGVRAGRSAIRYTFLDHVANDARFAGHDADNYETYKLGLQQKFTPDLMAFATFATGYKSLAYDIGTGFNQLRQDSGPVRPETSKDWQAGIKSQLFDRRVTLNLTLFNTRFKNFQAQGIETLADGTSNFRLANVGRLRTRGVELEGSVRVADDLSVSGGVTYADARILSFPFAQCYPGQTAAQGCTGTPARQDLAGFRPAQAPLWKLAANAEYTPHLTSRLDGLVQLAYSYQSAINFGINQDPQTRQPGYGIANISLGIRPPDRRWELVGFVNNLFDKHYFSNMTNSFGNQGNQLATQSYLARDFNRYGGVRASFKF
ncbi:TonB-dependent receptor [Sphingomonas morindae]|uniref:TonB-dependent receptor n=1 Tax=Sphingomonas morindae TaxID=1541170 RepID=A0ABY4X4W5_9SPHN|nr:TonB-dependent receptor [Sphingomonas morindae]USI71929.1 TonB-dependent receptor [Sphingomonas morindae]